MSAATTTPTTKSASHPEKANNSVVAIYHHHTEAEEAVHRLERAGIPIQKVSIIGRNFQIREDVQGYYRPSDAGLEGAGFGAWMGGLFGLLMGFGLFVFPVAGTLIVLGPTGRLPGYLMRRGSLFLAKEPSLSPTFLPCGTFSFGFTRLFSDHLKIESRAAARLLRSSFARYAGDMAVLGKGEVLVGVG